MKFQGIIILKKNILYIIQWKQQDFQQSWMPSLVKASRIPINPTRTQMPQLPSFSLSWGISWNPASCGLCVTNSSGILPLSATFFSAALRRHFVFPFEVFIALLPKLFCFCYNKTHTVFPKASGCADSRHSAHRQRTSVSLNVASWRQKWNLARQTWAPWKADPSLGDEPGGQDNRRTLPPKGAETGGRGQEWQAVVPLRKLPQILGLASLKGRSSLLLLSSLLFLIWIQIINC